MFKNKNKPYNPPKCQSLRLMYSHCVLYDNMNTMSKPGSQWCWRQSLCEHLPVSQLIPGTELERKLWLTLVAAWISELSAGPSSWICSGEQGQNEHSTSQLSIRISPKKAVVMAGLEVKLPGSESSLCSVSSSLPLTRPFEWKVGAFHTHLPLLLYRWEKARLRGKVTLEVKIKWHLAPVKPMRK